MKIELLVSVLVAVISAVGGLFYRAKYKAEVGKTSADTGKISAETITTLLKAVDDATRGFNEQLKALKSEWEGERAKWTAERDKWIAEREVERAIWHEREQKLEGENSRLRVLVSSGATEQKTVRLQIQNLAEQLSAIAAQLEILKTAVEANNAAGTPSKDPVLESGN